MHLFIEKAEFGVFVKIPGNRVHFLEPKVNTIGHTLRRITRQEETCFWILAEQQEHRNLYW